MLRDDGRVVVLLEERQQIVLVDIGLVAQADDRRDAHLGRARKADDRHADAARLRRQRGVALDVVRGAEGRAQVLRRVVEAVDVRPHQPHAVLAADVLDFLLPLDVAGLGEARRDEHRAGNLLFADFDQRLRDELGGNREHRDVDLAGNVLDALVGLPAHDLAGGRIDRVDLALVAAVDQVLHHRVADLAFLGGSADHRDRVRLHDAVHVAHDVVVAGPEARRRRTEIDDDAHVGGDRAALAREHRIQIHFGDLGEIGDQLRDVLDQRGERVAVDRIGAANALEYFRRGDAVEHRQRVFARRRREPERDVLEHLDQDSAETEGDQLAERRIGHGADDDFLPAGQHLLDLDAEQIGFRVVLFGVGHDRREALVDLVGAFHSDQNAAGLGLVQDFRRDDLHHHRKADSRGELRRFGGRRRHALPSAPRCRRRRRRACPRAPSARCGPPPSPCPGSVGLPSCCSPSLAPPSYVVIASAPRAPRALRSLSRRAARRPDPCRSRARSGPRRCARPAAASASPRSGCRTS